MARPPFPPQVASDQPPPAPKEYPVMSQQAPAQPSSLRPAVPHHSSPVPGDVQTPYAAPPNKQKKITKMPPVPMHITKHPNPVGRPKNKRY